MERPEEVEAGSAALFLMRTAAQTARPREACGALLGLCEFGVWWHVTAAQALANHATDAEREYLITADQVRSSETMARAAGLEVVGFFHSHPAGGHTPSATDLSRAWPGYLYAIVDATSGVTGFWTLAEDRSSFRRLGTYHP
jgi:proteasome lid subunit RPN8/RPN11